MNFKYKHNPTAYDIPLVAVEMPALSAGSVVQVIDFTDSLSGNVNSGVKHKKLEIVNESTKTLGTITFSEVMITNECKYDTSSKRYIPLWYTHRLPTLIRNTKTIIETMRVKNKQSPLTVVLPVVISDARFIVSGSVRVTYKSGAATIHVPEADYHVDYSTGTLTINTTAITAVYFDIQYEVINNTLKVTAPKSVYRIQAERSAIGDHYFLFSVLTDTPDSVTVAYEKTNAYGEKELVKEQSTADLLYTQVDNQSVFTMANGARHRVFSVTGSTIMYSSYNKYDQVYARSANQKLTAVNIQFDSLASFDECWNLQITGGPRYRSRSEHPTIIDNKTVSVNCYPLRVFKNSLNEWDNITITRENGTTIPVASVDPIAGFITTGELISKKEILTIQYEYKSSYAPINHICFNPHHAHMHPEQAVAGFQLDRTYVAFIKCVVSGVTYYTVIALPKFNVDGGWITYNRATVAAYAAAHTDALYYRTPDGAFVAFDIIRNGMAITALEALSLCYLTSILDTDAYTVHDARTFGGGTDTDIPNQYDRSRYDGELTDLAGHIAVTVPKRYYDAIKAKAQEWDASVITSSNPEVQAGYAAETFITDIIERSILPGTTTDITIIKT